MKRMWVLAGALAVVALVALAGWWIVVNDARSAGGGTGGGGSNPPGSSTAATCAQVAVPLGSSADYAVLGYSTVTNTGATAVTGDLGLSPGTSVTGFPPGTFSGTENLNNSASATAQADLTSAYANASGRSNCAGTVAGNIGGLTLTPGLYVSSSSLAISSGYLTLNGQGNAGAVFIFQIASTLTVTSGLQVVLTNGTQAANVFWQVSSSATLGTTCHVSGTIMAYASITLDTGATLDGRALAKTGAISMESSQITMP